MTQDVSVIIPRIIPGTTGIPFKKKIFQMTENTRRDYWYLGCQKQLIIVIGDFNETHYVSFSFKNL